MGSWSVYCSISRIAITAGDDAVFIPLKKNDGYVGYDKYIPATLPIFGTYDDYGGMEDIVEDGNTKIIEDYFKCTIDEFVKFLSDGRKDYNDNYSEWHGKEHLKELEDWTYMWVDRKVFDFMSTYCPNIYHGNGDFYLGNKTILEKMGFEFIENEKDKKRYNIKYKSPNGSIVYSDGTWLEGSCYRLDDIQKRYGADISYFINKCQNQIYPIMGKKWCFEHLGYVLGIRYDTFFDYEEMLNKLKVEGLIAEEFDGIKFPKKETNILKSYQDNIMEDFVLEQLSNLVSIKRNMYPMSTSWEPYVLYTTAQCGEHAAHQKLLEEFCKINASKIGDEEK